VPDVDSVALPADLIADELADCRQRGIERLDRRSHNQVPLQIPQLEQLARRHAAVSRLPARSRVTLIKTFLRSALASYAQQGNSEDADLIGALFFGDAVGFVARTAGELLDLAKDKFGEQNHERFREKRRIAFREFAGFLIGFAVPEDAADPGPDPEQLFGLAAATAHSAPAAVLPGDSAPGAAEPESEQPESEQDRIERALIAASSFTICGIAPRSLVDAMQRLAKQMSAAGQAIPWERITYITPASALIFATQGNARLGTAVQKWQAALKGIRDCVRQIQEDAATDVVPRTQLALTGIMDLYLETVLVATEQDTNREQIWVSVGPNLGRHEPLYLSLGPADDNFRHVKAMVDRLSKSGTAIVERELEMSPEGLEDVRQLGPAEPAHRLRVRSIQPLGATASSPSCLPVAITILRSAEAGRPVVLLKERSRFTDLDNFDKLSLLSARLLEEDLAGALGVPIFPEHDATTALDAMWKALGRQEQLAIPQRAFVRAAQREVFRSCGLDIPAERFTHRGCQLVERDDQPGCFNFFCVFEVILYRQRSDDELELAKTWNDHLKALYEDLLYSPGAAQRLNHFLVARQEWLMAEVFSRPTVFSERGE
jgi:hypothetical protein